MKECPRPIKKFIAQVHPRSIYSFNTVGCTHYWYRNLERDLKTREWLWDGGFTDIYLCDFDGSTIVDIATCKIVDRGLQAEGGY